MNTFFQQTRYTRLTHERAHRATRFIDENIKQKQRGSRARALTRGFLHRERPYIPFTLISIVNFVINGGDHTQALLGARILRPPIPIQQIQIVFGAGDGFAALVNRELLLQLKSAVGFGARGEVADAGRLLPQNERPGARHVAGSGAMRRSEAAQRFSVRWFSFNGPMQTEREVESGVKVGTTLFVIACPTTSN